MQDFIILFQVISGFGLAQSTAKINHSPPMQKSSNLQDELSYQALKMSVLCETLS
jgi:hypothetical protein